MSVKTRNQAKGYIGGGSTEYSAYNYLLTGVPSNVEKLGTVEGVTESNVKELFKNARAGDFVQMKRRNKNKNGNYNPHSAIVAGVTNEGVWFLEANAPDAKGGNYKYNKIKYQFQSWADLARQNSDMSVYYAKKSR